MVRVKICGITNISDAENAVTSGADALGFVFAESPRKISKEDAAAIIEKIPPFVTCVGLFVNEDIDKVKEVCTYCKISTVQFHGNETQDYMNRFPDLKIIKALRIRDKNDILQLNDLKADAYLLDSFSKERMGGTGLSFDWKLLEGSKNPDISSDKFKRIIVAGGLNPDNVAEAIKLTSPFGVDVSSGVEARPGIKDKEMMESFISTSKHL